MTSFVGISDMEWERVVEMSLPREIDNADIIAVRDAWAMPPPPPRLVRTTAVSAPIKVVVRVGDEVVGVRYLRVDI